MTNIVSTSWDFGNGETSNELNPVAVFEPGSWTVTLNVTDSDGNISSIIKTLYVSVGQVDSTLSDGNYIDYPKCLHFGWKDEHGFGWSFNEGDFPWPITPASIVEYEENGIVSTLVWDVTDGKEYHINTYNNYENNVSYKDKGEHSIRTEVVTPEFTGEMKSYDVSHIETNLLYKPDILQDDFLPDFEVDVSLITDSGSEPVETQRNVDTRNEVMFYFQNRQTPHTRQRQLRLNTTESNYQLLTYESYFKTNDRLKRAEANQSMEFFGMPTEWFTRGEGYNFNRTDGSTNDNVITNTLEGPDGVADTGVTAIGFAIGNDTERESIVVWGKSLPSTSPSVPLTIYGTPVNGWYLYYYNGTMPVGFKISGTLFDVRLFDAVVTEDTMTEYHDKFKYYLPRA